LHIVPIINKARRGEANPGIVDTRRTKIAEQADLHIALRPGTDVVLAWAMAADLERQGGFDREFIARHVDGFEDYMALARRYSLADAARICGVDERLVREFAEWYRTMNPAVITVGNGLERNRNGGSGIRAIFAPPALAGKFGVPGGGLINGAGFAFRRRPRAWRGPTSCRPARACSTSSTSAVTSPTRRWRRRSRRCSSTTTTPSSCIPTRTACAAASSARTSSWSAPTS